MGEATLNEVSGSQTRLNQVFTLNEQDHYLSFTLSGAGLDAPDANTFYTPGAKGYIDCPVMG